MVQETSWRLLLSFQPPLLPPRPQLSSIPLQILLHVAQAMLAVAWVISMSSRGNLFSNLGLGNAEDGALKHVVRKDAEGKMSLRDGPLWSKVRLEEA